MSDDVTLIPPQEAITLAVSSADFDADDTAVINAQAAIELRTISQIEGLRRLNNFLVDAYFEKTNEDSLPMQSQKDYHKGLSRVIEDDGLLQTIGKYLYFNEIRGIDLGDLAKVYGTPVEHFQSTKKFHPQVTIIFKELSINDQDLPLRNYYLEKIVSIRLLKENIPKSENDLEDLRVKIVDVFSGFTYTSSKTKVYTYTDKQEGLFFSIAAEREIAKTIIEKALSIQDMQYSDRLLTEKIYPDNPPLKINVLGKEVNEPNYGRWGEVRFNRIEYKQSGIVDRILRPLPTV